MIVQYAMIIALILPSTTCTGERSFITLRRVKTWLQRTSVKDRTSALTGLCMICMHRNKVKENLQEITSTSTNDFVSQPRRLQFLFTLDV